MGIEEAWKMVVEEIIVCARYVPSNPHAQRLSESAIKNWHSDTATLTVKIDDPEWFNQRVSRLAARYLGGALDLSSPHVVFVN